MGEKGFDVVEEAKDSMRRRYKLRKNCATKLTGESMLDYVQRMLAEEEVSKGNTMVAA